MARFGLCFCNSASSSLNAISSSALLLHISIISVSSFISVLYLHMLIMGVMPMPPLSMAIRSYSPSNVILPYGPSIPRTSPTSMESSMLEKSCPVSFFVNSICSSSVELLEMLNGFFTSFPSIFRLTIINCPAL